ncbi:MAG: hypothetical protein IK073_05840 [Paludibacteraceae bacterium]|nr:hypothetical protein [Paludibacteraceae bacterium]
MISFISSAINNPWSDKDMVYSDPTWNDKVIYNPRYNSRITLTDKNVYLCTFKTNAQEYKNVYLFAVTRRLFYFLIFDPYLEVMKDLKSNEQISRFISHLPLSSKCLVSNNSEKEIYSDIQCLDGSCLMVKVNAPIENFLFPRNQEITNEEIKSKYAILNNLYFQIEKEYNGLGELIDKYNTALHRKLQQQEDRLKRFLIRKGVRTGISWALAGFTCGLSVGLDALFDLSDVADIGDMLDMADMADAVGSSVDAMDVLDVDVTDFSYADIVDINIEDIGEGDDLLADSYHVSFGSNSRMDNIDRIYDSEINNAYDRLERDIDRINEKGAYSWENPTTTIKRDNSSIQYWERSKKEAILQAQVDQSKQDYWNAISDYCRERMSKKIGGR